MAHRAVRYREIRYEVGFCSDTYSDTVEFFVAVLMDGEMVGRPADAGCWTAPLDDPKLMSLAFGAAQSVCDQENASLQDRGMNRVREVT